MRWEGSSRFSPRLVGLLPLVPGPAYCGPQQPVVCVEENKYWNLSTKFGTLLSPALRRLRLLFSAPTRSSATGSWACSMWGPKSRRLGTRKNVLEPVKKKGNSNVSSSCRWKKLELLYTLLSFQRNRRCCTLVRSLPNPAPSLTVAFLDGHGPCRITWSSLFSQLLLSSMMMVPLFHLVPLCFSIIWSLSFGVVANLGRVFQPCFPSLIWFVTLLMRVDSLFRFLS
jgi:hypothetical protein